MKVAMSHSKEKFSPARLRRFRDRVQFGDEKGCWLWTGAIEETTGYGRLCVNNHPIGAHKYSYELFKGPIPEGQSVLHSCDVRRCVNPNRLFVGTHQDNSRDMVSKGRQCKGEKRPNAKLTPEDVKSIRDEYSRGHTTQKALGLRYGIKQQAVSDIIRRRNWKDAI